MITVLTAKPSSVLFGPDALRSRYGADGTSRCHDASVPHACWDWIVRL